jgi:hypothetical protein
LKPRRPPELPHSPIRTCSARELHQIRAFSNSDSDDDSNVERSIDKECSDNDESDNESDDEEISDEEFDNEEASNEPIPTIEEPEVRRLKSLM